ncbi:MAG: hypothetical protein QXR60_04085 [Candidatus Nanoarchaeia archaeon]
MGRKLLSYDEEIDRYLCEVVNSLKNVGIKNASRSDALRFIIRQNQEVRLRFKKKRNTKDDYVFF